MIVGLRGLVPPHSPPRHPPPARPKLCTAGPRLRCSQGAQPGFRRQETSPQSAARSGHVECFQKFGDFKHAPAPATDEILMGVSFFVVLAGRPFSSLSSFRGPEVAGTGAVWDIFDDFVVTP